MLCDFCESLVTRGYKGLPEEKSLGLQHRLAGYAKLIERLSEKALTGAALVHIFLGQANRQRGNSHPADPDDD